MSKMALIPVTLMVACGGNDTNIIAQNRELTTEQATIDAGMIAVGDRQTLDIYLASTAQGKVTVSDVMVDDEDHWQVLPSWKTWDEDYGEEADDQMTIAGMKGDTPEYAPLEIIFKPDSEGQFRTVLTIISNDTEVQERTDDGDGIWKVVLRGIGAYPCGIVFPSFFDFGSRSAGGYWGQDAIVQNCGNVTLTVADFDVLGSTSFSVETSLPMYVLPNSSEPFEVGFTPAGGTPPEAATLSIDMNDPSFAETIELIGNDCEQSIDPTWDSDGDGWLYDGGDSYVCGGDCNDLDGSVSPSSPERAGNGVDDNCNGTVDETSSPLSEDNDGDGESENEGDCDDTNPDISSSATEVLNQIDDDCDGRVDEGTDWYDDDGDGYSEREGDCDDTKALVYPGADESQNETDDDCDGIVDEGSYTYDNDGDGYAYIMPDGSEVDCDDEDPWSFPGANEDCDNRDNDCDGYIDEGPDDEENGACAFIVERKAAVQPAPKGCSTASLASVPLATLLLGVIAVARRRA